MANRKARPLPKQCAATVYYDNAGKTGGRQCTRHATPGHDMCGHHRARQATVHATVVGEDDVCSFCTGVGAKVLRTSKGDGLIAMCPDCAKAVRRLLTAIAESAPRVQADTGYVIYDDPDRGGDDTYLTSESEDAPGELWSRDLQDARVMTASEAFRELDNVDAGRLLRDRLFVTRVRIAGGTLILIS